MYPFNIFIRQYYEYYNVCSTKNSRKRPIFKFDFAQKLACFLFSDSSKMETNQIFERNPLHHTHRFRTNFSEFITTSSTLPGQYQYPLNYQYGIYNTWDTSVVNALKENKENPIYPCCKFCWWYPNQDSVSAEFLESSSMHGLKYVAQPKKHFIERLFWLGSFIACLVAAVVMISEIWNRYYENPVIVTFNPLEHDVDSIPFPAVTICNTNPFKRSWVEDLSRQYREGETESERKQALESLRVINSICTSQQSFLKGLNYARKRGAMTLPEARENPSEEMEKNLTKFLLQNTQPCRELIRRCVWEQQEGNCEELFKPILSDYGKCCTFNMLPQQLMEYNVTREHRIHSESKTGESAWSDYEVDEWAKWNFAFDGYTLDSDLKFPRRQHRAGLLDGLSLLIDPDTTNSFCPSSDSEGIKIMLHDPLDAPRVADLGSIIGVSREVFMEVKADLTMVDDGISDYSHEQRKCYYSREFKLDFYKPYTRSNCLEECWRNILFKNCSCVLYYSPRNGSTSVCSSNPNSDDVKCIRRNERLILGRLHKTCAHCKYSCNDLSYAAEVTYASLQSAEMLWKEILNETGFEWMSNRLAITHIFMGSDTVVPKLRQKLYQTVDLIANTGGLLGLSIGFSILSLVEIVYFATVRICCRRIRKSERYGPGPDFEHDKFRRQSSSQNHHRVGRNGIGFCPSYDYGQAHQNVVNPLVPHNGKFLHGIQNTNIIM